MAGKLECLSVGVLVADHLCAPISHLPRPGELVLSDALPLAIGGCAANAGVDLARLGVRVGVVGCVGRDAFGRFITETLGAQGVETSDVRQLEKFGTSGTLIINVQGEDRRFIHTLGANAAFTAADIPRERLSEVRVLYVGGYLLMPALDPEELAEVFREARRRGIQTVLDVVLPGPGPHRERLAPVLRETDYFLPNSDEAAVITGESDPIQQAEAFLQDGVRVAVITCGGEGTVLCSREERLRAATYPANYVGGTGAGDAFDAGFIAGLLAGGSTRDCLTWGSALGASCVRAVGATESVFHRAEALEFMRQHPLTIESLD